MLSIRKGLALMLAVTVLVAAGCGSTKSTREQKDPVKIQFWHAMADDSAHGKVLADLIREFNNSQQDVIVESTYQGGYADLEKKLVGGLQANNPPHVFQATDSMLVKLVDEKAVQALDAFVPAKEKADYARGLLDAQTIDGKLYGLPFNKSMLVLIYDKSVVTKPPTNWTEFRQVAREVTIKGKRYGTAFNADVFYFGTHYAMTGAKWLSADNKVLFNGPEGVEAMNLIVDMVKDGSAIQLMPKEYQSSYFNEGRAAMIATTTASFAYINPASGAPWGAAPLYSHKTNAVPISGANVAMVEGIRKEEAQAAATFMLWLTGKEAQLTWATGKTGYMPVRKSALETPQWKAFVSENPIYAVFGLQIERGVVQPNHRKWGDVQKLLTTAVEKAVGGADVKSVLDEAARAANEALARK